MAKMGRPRKEVDWKQFDQLCSIQCTEQEIAAWFDMKLDTLNARCKEKYDRTFSDVYGEKRQAGKSSLRRSQFKKAMEGNPTMLIWLGKQYLKQADKHEIDQNTTMTFNWDAARKVRLKDEEE